MKFNGTIFSKPQQDQLKENIGNELEKVSAKVDEVDARMLNYKGDWITGGEYHENDVVTWDNDGHLYEVIKAHTSSGTIKPDNTEYYKAMTSTKYVKYSLDLSTETGRNTLISLSQVALQGKRVMLHDGGGVIEELNEINSSGAKFSRISLDYDDSYNPTAMYNILVIVRPSIAKYCYLKVNKNGTFENNSINIKSINLFVEA